MPQNDPPHQDQQAQDQDRVPTVDGDALGAAGEGFRPAPLSRTAMAFLKRSLAHQQRRRAAFQARLLRVCVDGEALWQVDPRRGVGEEFRVPLGASTLEIFGDDGEGTLLLAVFPLPEAVVGGGAQHLWVTLEGGQTVAIDIALARESEGKGGAYVIQLAYADGAAVATQGAEPLVMEAVPEEVDPAPSALAPAPMSASRDPNDPVEARLFAEIRGVQAQAKELFAEVERVQAQAKGMRKVPEQTKELRARVQHNLRRLRELCQDMPWVRQRRQAQDRQDPETPHRDVP